MACRQCGQCCVYAIVPIPGATRDHDPMEIVSYLEAHNCKVYDGEQCLMLRIPMNCQHLEFDTATNTAHCLIYDRRPQLCRDYLCDAAREAQA